MKRVNDRPACYSCVHRMSLAGDCHSACNKRDAIVRGEKHGEAMGWFWWPINYDPIWLEECDSWEQAPEGHVVPMTDTASEMMKGLSGKETR